MNKDDLNDVVLVSGSSRIPKVRQMLKILLNGKELCKSVNPDEAVAYGAAIKAAMLTGQSNEKVQNLVLVEVIPRNRNNRRSDGCFDSKRHPIPFKKVKNFTAREDNQTSALLEVFAGKRARSRDNKWLRQFILSGLQMAPRGVPEMDVCFDLQANGILFVSAKDVFTGKETSISTKSGKLAKEQIDRMLYEGSLDKLESEKHRRKIEARSALEKYVLENMERLKDNNTLPFAQKKKKEDALQKMLRGLSARKELSTAYE